MKFHHLRNVHNLTPVKDLITRMSREKHFDHLGLLVTVGNDSFVRVKTNPAFICVINADVMAGNSEPLIRVAVLERHRQE